MDNKGKNIDQWLKDSLQNYQQQPDSQSWDRLNSALNDPIQTVLKDKLSPNNATPNLSNNQLDAMWAGIQKDLPTDTEVKIGNALSQVESSSFSDATWNSIANQLPKASNFYWVSRLAVILIGLILCLNVIISDSIKGLFHQYSSQDSVVEKNDKQNQNHSVLQQENLLKIANQPQFSFFLNDVIKVVNEKASASDVFFNQFNHSPRADNTKSTYAGINLSLTNHSNSNKNNHLSPKAFAKTNNPIANVLNDIVEREINAHSYFMDLAPIYPTQIRFEIDLKDKPSVNNLNVNISKPILKSILKGWFVGASSTVLITKNKASVSDNGFVHQNYLPNASIKDLITYQPKIEIGYNYHNFIFSSGFNYQKSINNIDYTFINNKFPVVDAVSGKILGYVTQNYGDTITVKTKQTRTQIGIPLSIGYQKYIYKGLSVNSKITGMYCKTITANGDGISEQDLSNQPNEFKNLIANQNVNILINFGLGIDLPKGFQIKLEPGYGRMIFNDYKPSSHLKVINEQWQVTGGLYWYFSK